MEIIHKECISKECFRQGPLLREKEEVHQEDASLMPIR